MPEEHPILTAVKSQVQDQSKPFAMMVHAQIKVEHRVPFEAAFKECIAATRREPGCIGYDLNRSTEDGSKYINYERWASVAALDAHLNAAHTVKLLTTIGPFMAAAPEVKVYVFAGE